MKHLQALAAAVMLLPAQLLAQLPPNADFRLPSGVEVAGAISTICIGEAQGAILGFAARESGRNLEYVLARFPEPQDAALRSIYRGVKLTVEDVFAHPSIGYHTMFYYRSKACFRERTELKVMPSIVFSAAGLLRCEREHGRENSPALLACVDRVVGSL
jgi:hypothetical protein